eukprot:727268-Karenia_brevis.AAC.1
MPSLAYSTAVGPMRVPASAMFALLSTCSNQTTMSREANMRCIALIMLLKSGTLLEPVAKALNTPRLSTKAKMLLPRKASEF